MPIPKQQPSIFSGFSKIMRRLVGLKIDELNRHEILFQFFQTKEEKIEYTATIIPDIERHDFCFTDGCGKISLGLARMVAQHIGIRITEEVCHC